MEKYLNVNKLKRLLTVSRVIEYGDTEQVINMIDEQPAADVKENIYGKWLESDDKFKTSEKLCSECGTDFHIVKANEWKFLYCPFCGAKMKYEE